MVLDFANVLETKSAILFSQYTEYLANFREDAYVRDTSGSADLGNTPCMTAKTYLMRAWEAVRSNSKAAWSHLSGLSALGL